MRGLEKLEFLENVKITVLALKKRLILNTFLAISWVVIIMVDLLASPQDII